MMKDPNCSKEVVKFSPQAAAQIFQNNILHFPDKLFLKVKEMSFDSPEEIDALHADFEKEFRENLEKHREVFEEWEWEFFQGDAEAMKQLFNVFIARMHLAYHSFLIQFSDEGSEEVKQSIEELQAVNKAIFKEALSEVILNIESFAALLMQPENYNTFGSLISILISEFHAAMKHLEDEENVRIELEREGVRRDVQEIVAGFQILNDKPCEVMKLPVLGGAECPVKKECKPKLLPVE